MPETRAASSNAPPISCYIRTFNEERMIGRVVEAAFQVAREVVVIDSGSSDATRAIAEEKGAGVIEQPWLGNGLQKRVGEDACSHDWLLDLDADEVVTPALAASIKALFAPGDPPDPAYYLTLMTVPAFGKPWRDFALADRAKLYDRRRIRMREHKEWDQLDLPKGFSPKVLEGRLAHYSFSDFEHYVAKRNRVSSARARNLKLKPRWVLVLRILFGYPVYFVRHYFQRGHLRNGVYGFAIAGAAAFGRWMRDVKMYERYLKDGDGSI